MQAGMTISRLFIVNNRILVGLGNQFLSNIREVDSILQVVRCFEDDDIVHVNGKVDPRSDIDVINLEMIFSDLGQNLILLNLIAILMSKRWLKQHQTCSLVWLQYQLS
ncbi:uncharacterized protein [Miscanthus floridulus]|uniref:uncharacterized protein isoform X3 n=1 Tax=Miscanthus floridulus TaxID=154761 RepID=UPI003459CCEF